MKRRMVIALAAALACPIAVAAQERAAERSHFTISPFLGYAFAYQQRGTATFTDAQGSYASEYTREVEGGWMPGVEADYRLPGRFGLSAAVAYNKRGEESFNTDFVDVASLFSKGSKMYFLRGAVTMDLRDSEPGMQITHPEAHLAVGPALVREVPDVSTGRPASNSFALNGAANAALPLPWKGFAVRVVLEDYMTYLPRGDIAVQLATDLSGQVGSAYAAELTGGATHLYVLRAGLSYSFSGLSLPRLHF